MSAYYYLTYNEFNKGVYKSQVIDSLGVYNSLGKDFKLVALLPISGFIKNSKWIKQEYPNSIIFPAIPTLSLLFINLIYFIFLSNGSSIFCRGGIAVSLALKMRWKFNKIVYDARAAIAEEHKEYGNGRKYNRLSNIEKRALLNSDLVMSVSNSLVEHWKKKFLWDGKNYVVIPCCTVEPENNIVNQIHDSFFDKITVVFSGSTHLWQSFSLNCGFVQELLLNDENVNVLFLSQNNPLIESILTKFGRERVRRLWVLPDEVNNYLSICDYGLMLRDDNITNNVSAPVKFGEYLVNGLQVIISPSVRDYASFVSEHNCGFLWAVGDPIPRLSKNTDKYHQTQLARGFFLRNSDITLRSIKKVFSLL